jgi:hypothetical protein
LANSSVRIAELEGAGLSGDAQDTSETMSITVPIAGITERLLFKKGGMVVTSRERS